jgi:ComF family protein
MRWLEPLCIYLGDVVSPLRCAACDGALSGRTLLCTVCAGTVIRWEREGDPLAFGHYGGALASTLLRLKYARRPDLAQPLGQLLRSVVLANHAPRDIDVVVPVPVPFARLVDRGYNQAALIARPLVGPLSARFAPRALGRRDGSVKQAALNRTERLENLRDAFVPRQPEKVRGRRVLLVDDVSTTGATLAACRAVLASCGAAEVHAAVVARTESLDL